MKNNEAIHNSNTTKKMNTVNGIKRVSCSIKHTLFHVWSIDKNYWSQRLIKISLPRQQCIHQWLQQKVATSYLKRKTWKSTQYYHKIYSIFRERKKNHWRCHFFMNKKKIKTINLYSVSNDGCVEPAANIRESENGGYDGPYDDLLITVPVREFSCGLSASPCCWGPCDRACVAEPARPNSTEASTPTHSWVAEWNSDRSSCL